MKPKVALVTGGARRIGAAITRALHAAGACVAIHYHRSSTEADQLAGELEALRPGSTLVVQGDLLGADTAQRLIAETCQKFGRLDLLVNNASSFHATPVGNITDDAWLDLIGTNLKAPLFISQAAAPALTISRGAIINIVDIHAERPLKNYVVYSIAKAGLVGLTRSLALELGPAVRVNAIAPGAILWPEESSDFSDAERQTIVDRTILKSTGSAENIACAVKYLGLDASFVTGQVLAVDGGRNVYI